MASFWRALVRVLYWPVQAFRDLDVAPIFPVILLFAAVNFAAGFQSQAWMADPRLSRFRNAMPWLADPRILGAVRLAMSLAFTTFSSLMVHAVAVLMGGRGSFRRLWTAGLLVSAVAVLLRFALPPQAVWPVSLWALSINVVALSVIHELPAGKALLTFLGGWVLEIVILAILLVSGALCYVAKARGKAARQTAPAVDVTTLPADYDWTVRSLEGKDVSMTAAKGKTVVLNFWATWCGPCRAEMPSLQALHDKVKGEGVQFYLVSSEDPATVKAFAAKEGYTMPVYTASGHPDVYDTAGIPATFILSPGGRIMRRQVGMWDWDSQEVLRFIRAVEGDTTPPADPAASWPELGPFHMISSSEGFQVVRASFEGVCRSSAGIVAVTFSSGTVKLLPFGVKRNRRPSLVRVGLSWDTDRTGGWTSGGMVNVYNVDKPLKPGEILTFGPKTVLIPVDERSAPLAEQHFFIEVVDVDADHPDNKGTSGGTNLRAPQMRQLKAERKITL
jgi:thiol-disulfide isomerase/thioredoxin